MDPFVSALRTFDSIGIRGRSGKGESDSGDFGCREAYGSYVSGRGVVWYPRRMENRSVGDVGGTPGGLGSFLLGFFMACIGGYLIANQVKVVGSYWSFYGGNTFGITLLPMLFGIGILFWNGRSLIGWLLTVAGALFIFAGIIANLHIFFAPASLFETLVMLILLVGGLGLIMRSIQPHRN
jgi:hypothetical protein